MVIIKKWKKLHGYKKITVEFFSSFIGAKMADISYKNYFDSLKQIQPYKNEEEYKKEWFCFLDMCLLEIFSYQMQSEQKEKEGEFRQELLEVNNTLLSSVMSLKIPLRNRVDYPMGMEGRKELKKALFHLKSRFSLTSKKTEQFRCIQLIEGLKFNNLTRFFFLLAWAQSCECKYQQIFAAVNGDNQTHGVTFNFACYLYGLIDDIPEKEKQELLQLDSLIFDFVLNKGVSISNRSGDWEFFLDERIVGFLYSQEELLPHALESYVDKEIFDERKNSIIVRKEEAERIKKFYQYSLQSDDKKSWIFHLYGKSGNGKKLFVKQAVGAMGKSVLFVRISFLEKLSGKELKHEIRSLLRERFLQKAELCFIDDKGNHLGEEEQSLSPSVEYMIRLLKNREISIFWLSEEKNYRLQSYGFHLIEYESTILTVTERLILWKEFSIDYLIDEMLDLELCASKYVLTAQMIEEVLKTADALRAAKGIEKITQQEIQQSVHQHTPNQLGRYATQIPTVYTWDDLVIAKEQKRQLLMICNQLKYRNIVGEEWGFDKKTAYGRGICALFYGSPGTGKTMAVQVIANELGLDLYRVDLSQMVSKYIGETEKNISELFKRAKNMNVLLFFDEADSMFGKRTEVRDSKDKNANAETAHLLQKLEDYDGITILATNYINNIDDAFTRRIKFMINFVFPDAKVRRMLWKKILPKQVPCEESLDLDFFAENFELAGSNIKEVLTNAAYIAAAEHRNLSNEHIVEAIKLNFSKYGKVLSNEDFGYLGV